MPDKMGYTFTPAEKTTIVDALNTVLNILNAKKVVQLTKSERSKSQSIGNTRMPYVQQTIRHLAPQFQLLQPRYMSLPDAQNDIAMTEDMTEIMNLVTETFDRYTDFSIASEHFAYLYFRNYYAVAKSALDRNTPGADTVVNAIKPLFAMNDSPNETVPNP